MALSRILPGIVPLLPHSSNFSATEARLVLLTEIECVHFLIYPTGISPTQRDSYGLRPPIPHS